MIHEDCRDEEFITQPLMDETIVLISSSKKYICFERCVNDDINKENMYGWKAKLFQGFAHNSPWHTLPIITPSGTTISNILSRLQAVPCNISKTRVHIIPDYKNKVGPLFVYLGRLGLMGGAPILPPQQRRIEWVAGPHMDLSSEDERHESFHIPVGYRYKDYRIKPGSTVQRASCTIRYIEANSEEEIKRLISSKLEQSAGGHLSADIPNIFTLGSIDGGIHRARAANHRTIQSARMKHAAVVLYGKTKRNKVFRRKSKIRMAVEIGLLENSPPLPTVQQDSGQLQDPTPPVMSNEVGQLLSRIAGLELQIDADNVAQAKIQDQIQEELSQASSEREALQAQLQAFQAANTSLQNERASLLSQLESLKTQDDVSSISETVALTSESVLSSTASNSFSVHEPVSLVDDSNIPVVVEVSQDSDPAVPSSSHSEVRLLHQKKLKDSSLLLTAEESIKLLTFYIAEGVLNARKLSGKEAIVVLGNTGAGKSTFLNYLMGCDMMLKDSEELGLDGLDDEVVVVRSRSEGGKLDEFFKIGHKKQSETFLPHIEQDPRNEVPYAYCDCPGFLDNRWPEVNIANAVNIRRALQEASNVRLMILINYQSLQADRGRGLSDMLKICTQLFGSADRLEAHKNSVSLGITHVPPRKKLEKVRKFLLKDSPPVLQSLTERMFFYDPMNEGGDDFSGLAGCRSMLGSLMCLNDAKNLFHTVLTDSDERMLRDLVEQQKDLMAMYLSTNTYKEASSSWEMLLRLRVIDNISVERLLQHSCIHLMEHLSGLETDFRERCHMYDFDEAERLLKQLISLIEHFSFSEFNLDLPDPSIFRSYIVKCQEREAAERRRREELEAELKQAINDKKELMAILKKQHEETLAQLEEIRKDHTQQKAELEKELKASRAQFDEVIEQTRVDFESKLRQKEEALSLVAKLNAQEKRELENEVKNLREEYSAKLESARLEKQEIEAKHKAKLTEQKKQQEAKEAELSSTVAALDHQVSTTAAQLQSLQETPSIAFGPEQWKEYFGVGVVDGDKCPLPENIEGILMEKSPFLLDDEKTKHPIGENHLLVLIPGRIKYPDGRVESFTLECLGDMILHNHDGNFEAFKGNDGTELGQNSHGYLYYGENLSYTNRLTPISNTAYWILLPKNILKNTREKTFDSQLELITQNYEKSGYRVPYAVEVAACLLAQYAKSGGRERLYRKSRSADGTKMATLTHCCSIDKNRNRLRVGNFRSDGLFVGSADSYCYRRIGKTCCREL